MIGWIAFTERCKATCASSYVSRCIAAQRPVMEDAPGPADTKGLKEIDALTSKVIFEIWDA